MSTKFGLGDRVQMTVTGTIARATNGVPGAFSIKWDATPPTYGYPSQYPEDFAGIRVVGQAKPKVGDEVDTEAEYDALPKESIVAYVNVNPVGVRWFKGNKGWSRSGYTVSSFDLAADHGARTVLYLPEGKA